MKTYLNRHYLGLPGTILAVVLLIAVVQITAGEESTLAVESAEAALQKAVNMCGFVGHEPQRVYAAASVSQLRILTDSTTPFLREYASGRTVWRVVLDNATPLVDSGLAYEWVTNVEVYVDSAEGHILKIVCNNEPLDPELDRELLSSDAEQQLLQGREEYVGFPAQAPSSTFAEAALACAQVPTSARQVIGQYVLLKFADRPIRPVWVVQLRGIPPIMPHVPHGASATDIPVYQCNRLRQVVDGITGRLLYDALGPNVRVNPDERQGGADHE